MGLLVPSVLVSSFCFLVYTLSKVPQSWWGHNKVVAEVWRLTLVATCQLAGNVIFCRPRDVSIRVRKAFDFFPCGNKPIGESRKDHALTTYLQMSNKC
jgi:hypothetical protein